VIALALFAQPAAATLTRYVLGRFTDRCGPERLIVPGLVIAAAGMAILALTSVPAMAIVGSVVFGAGFGLSQNATLSLMYARVPESQYVVVSAVWNIAYDAGMGLGAAGFGLLAAGTGYSAAFLITAAAMLVALIPALRDRKLGSQETKTATSRVRPRPPLDEQCRRTRRESRETPLGRLRLLALPDHPRALVPHQKLPGRAPESSWGSHSARLPGPRQRPR